MEKYDLIIIGSGPGGLTAGIYGGRQGSKTLMLDKGPAGGQGLEVPMMENYPGYEIIAGVSLIAQKKKQALKLAELHEMEKVTSIEPLGRIYKISTTKQEYHANSIILSTGSRHRPLDVPGEKEFLGQGVSYCATCDGPLFAGKDVLMIGGGNSAAQEALFLKNIGCNVTIVHRRDQLRADKYLKEKLEEHEIPIIWDSEVEEIKGNIFVESVVLNNKKTSQKTEVSVSGVFIAIGDEPINQLAKDLGLDIDHNGYIITDKFQRTNLERVYAAGDITGGVNQWIVACSEGAIAATAAFEDLQKM
ncbi:MAG: thioredoxin-disulfide reductase [Methanobacteriaceae archaeon]|nr:thioredoxin-disulfide reductase [Methanobacteriaceae archaeon]MDP2836061.1 thioredoxin-disulfide reductase [Methanobacteriaceae archaeon]MDP3035491.1 thioredoxin-disulfide reductase [Methanobacteriaceae archaeon]MDP3485424.1 thioredoxin-disulfide reductase [Methanobacteriaceae archaeon]MDP3623131.1 thioredoxin-disulfide reductase [Methanobacteriaceae archaeon]